MTGAEVALIVLGAVAFLLLGSFTCVVIDRLPLALDEPNQYGELWDSRPWPEVFGGRSRCSSCGEQVRPIDNVPILSWLVLRGRCRNCDERIPGFHPLVELAFPLLYVAAVWVLGASWTLLPALWLIPVGLAVAVIDLRRGELVHSLYLDERISELYDVITLPGVRRPKMLGFRTREIQHTLSIEGEAGLWRSA